MSDTETTTTTPAAQAPEATQSQETFSAAYVKELRNEAAAARIAKKDAIEVARQEVVKEYEPKLAEKDTAFITLQKQYEDTALELLKIKSVLEAEVPTADILEVAALVRGTDEESVKSSVARVKALLSKAPAKDRPVDHSQGSGSTVPLNGDPILNMLKAAVKAN